MPGIRDTERTVTFSNGVTNTFDQDFRVNYGAFNVTGNAGSKFLFRGGGNFSPFETKRDLPSQTGPHVAHHARISTCAAPRATATPILARSTTSPTHEPDDLGPRRPLPDRQPEHRRRLPGHRSSRSTRTSTPAGLAALPANVPRTSGYSSGVLVRDATARDEYTRDYIGVDATYLFNAGGQHQIHGGFQTERIANDAQTGYNADRIIHYAGLSYTTSTGEVAPRHLRRSSAC